MIIIGFYNQKKIKVDVKNLACRKRKCLVIGEFAFDPQILAEIAQEIQEMKEIDHIPERLKEHMKQQAVKNAALYIKILHYLKTEQGD